MLDQFRVSPLDLGLERLDLFQHLRVLVADALHHVEAAEEVVEVLGAEDDLDRATTVAVHIEGTQPLRDRRLGGREAALRDGEVMRVRLQVGVDLRELDVRVVVRLDRLLELRVRLVDLRQDGLCLGALRPDRGIRGRRRNGGQENREERRSGENDGRSLSRSRTIHKPVRSSNGMPVTTVTLRGEHRSSDGCRLQPTTG